MEMKIREMGLGEYKLLLEGQIPFYDKVVRVQESVIKVKQDKYFGLINNKGETILPTVFNEIEFQDNGDVVARRDQSFLVFSNHMHKCWKIKGKQEKNPVVYDEVIITPTCIIARTEDNKFYNFDVQGQSITNKAYDTFEEAELVGRFAW